MNRRISVEERTGTMKRRDLIKGAAALGFVASMPYSAFGKLSAGSGPVEAAGHPDASTAPARPNPLKPPAQGSIPVAFVVSEGAVIIDFCGPWEVFHQVSVPGPGGLGFHPYAVAETMNTIQTSGGMKIIPDYTLENAPAPKVIVIPAQNAKSEAMMEWIRKSTKTTDVTMSVCTGAYLLAATGLLSGKSATTHHAAYREFAMDFPDIHLKRGARFVEDGNLASAGGLSSGIDLALRVVERYFGREVAQATAYQMEYQGQGWLNPDSNEVYAKARVSTDEHPLCPVCWMDVDPASASKSVYKGKTYYFCMPAHKARFDTGPESWL
jgi:putative intracellular protease/amidase/YHS domain-containing protein